MERQTQFNIWYLIIAVLGVVLLRDMWVASKQVETIPYSEFQHHLQAGRIKEIAISSNLIHGTYKEALPDGRTQFVATRVDPILAAPRFRSPYRGSASTSGRGRAGRIRSRRCPRSRSENRRNRRG